MKKLIIDMDDVICEKNFIEMVNDFLKTNYKEDDACSYYINDLIPENKMNEWIEFFGRNNLYEYGKQSEDAKVVLEKLNKIYDIYIVTAYVFRDDESLSGKVLKDKFEYLYKNFSFLNSNKYIFANNKELIDADIRIDDNINNLKGKAETKLLFTAYHNKKLTNDELRSNNIIRVNNWREIENILM